MNESLEVEDLQASSRFAERALWSFVWTTVIFSGVATCSFWYWGLVAQLLGPLMVGGGLAGLVWTWTVTDVRNALYRRLTFFSTFVAVIFPQAPAIATRKTYGTDAAAFGQVAGRALAHGVNPYAITMTAAKSLLPVAGKYWTYTVGGSYINHFSYPSGGFLFYAFGEVLGIHHMVVDWVDLVAWIVTFVIIYLCMPASLKWLACLIVLWSSFLAIFANSETDVLMLPFLAIVVWRWDRYGDRSAGIPSWIGPIALGVACSIKQLPWLCVPFLVLGIFLESKRAGRNPYRTVFRYMGVVASTFLVLNLAFLIWTPHLWLKGVLLPFTGGLVADGQGFDVLATQGVVHGANLSYLTIASAFGVLASILSFWLFYDRLKRVWIVLAVLPFYVATRSPSGYLTDLIPVLFLAAFSILPLAKSDDVQILNPKALRFIFGALCLGVVLSSGFAFLGPPLQIKVLSLTETHSRAVTADHFIETVTIEVDNSTGSPLDPRFMVNNGSGAHGFWLPKDGKGVVIQPHQSKTVTLYHPTFPTFVPTSHWLVLAYTTGPTWLSDSGAVTVMPKTTINSH